MPEAGVLAECVETFNSNKDYLHTYMNTSLVKYLTGLALTSILAGCVSPSGRPDNTGTGALIGGASGAAIGAIADRRNPGAGALIGGAAGLIAGGLIGHSIDQQNEARSYGPPPTAYPVAPPPQPLSLNDIKAMARGGVSDDSIISQIITTRSVYHLDANAIIDLKSAGVSDKVIAYVINTADTVVATQAPPPPPVETVVVAPSPDYVWVGGEWVWNGGTWVWVGGRWMMPPYRHGVWIEARWVHDPRGWHREPGRWR